MSTESVNFCDMSKDERAMALADIHQFQTEKIALLKSAYGDDYHNDDGGGAWLNRITGFGFKWCWAPELDKAAGNWLAGKRSFWVRCGGAEMQCEMTSFPNFRVIKYMNDDTYGRRPIGSILKPENANEFRAE